MAETIEVRVARIEENVKFLVEDSKSSTESRKGLHSTTHAIQRSVDQITSSMALMSSEIAGVKHNLATQAPTIEEFITIKHRIVGASKIGKMIWVGGAFIIGTMFTHREVAIQWLSKL